MGWASLNPPDACLPTPSPQSRAWVLLRHTLPDGSWHYDWMLETRPGGPLTTFRVQHRPDALETRWFEAHRIADHRREYLTFEGPVSGERGHVRQLASGSLLAWEEREDAIACELAMSPDAFATVQWRGTAVPASPGLWLFERDA